MVKILELILLSAVLVSINKTTAANVQNVKPIRPGSEEESTINHERKLEKLHQQVQLQQQQTDLYEQLQYHLKQQETHLTGQHEIILQLLQQQLQLNERHALQIKQLQQKLAQKGTEQLQITVVLQKQELQQQQMEQRKQLQQELEQQQNQLTKQHEEILHLQQQQEGLIKQLERKREELDPLKQQLKQLLEKLRLHEEEHKGQMDKLQQQLADLVSLVPIPSCRAAPSNTSGIFNIQIPQYDLPFKGYCVMDSFDGGWLVIQQRQDGSVDFNRDWIDYRNGFGTPGSEYWMGLELIHKMTSARPHELVIEMISESDRKFYNSYSPFVIGKESDKYPLKEIGIEIGTAGDVIRRNLGTKFSTRDNDNDGLDHTDCAEQEHGGWWYDTYDDYCAGSILNGEYTKNHRRSKSGGGYTVKYSRMMIRPL